MTSRPSPGCPSCGLRPADADPVLRCPGCGADSELAARVVGRAVLRLGPQARACVACEQVTTVVEPEMVCADCGRAHADINERLWSRYVTVGPGDPADAPCVGCGHYASRPDSSGQALDILIECQGCGDQIAIPEEDFAVGQGLRLMCGRCQARTLVPKSVWCPNCGLHLRRLGIPELVRAANRDPRPATREERAVVTEIGPASPVCQGRERCGNFWTGARG